LSAVISKTITRFGSHNNAKKFNKLKIVKLKGQNRTFSAVCHHQGDDGNPDDGKQPKTFGFDLLILQFLTF